ncbi:MAG: transglycosylase SLT domain-containing protein [Gemmatimonadetes bacterium]|nr:transglycosylase SLT domain-containing protein [Gemmatimonadota bacterium]
MRSFAVAALAAVIALTVAAPAGLPLGAQSAVVARRATRDESRYDGTFKKYSKRFFGIGFDWRRFKAQGLAESGLDPEARSRVGAKGVMQLMPSTFHDIQSQRSDFGAIDDPEWNIAAGILHDRYLWKLWAADVAEAERPAFMFGSYNAGEGTIARATRTARDSSLDHARWSSIEQVAPTVPRWRYRETLGYVRTIEQSYQRLTTKR